MNRKVLIISNPGEIGADNYCEGVKKDVLNYTNFFKDTYGGAWFDSEIISLERPTKQKLDSYLAQIDAADYSIIVFTGHGYMNDYDTIIELKDGEEYNTKYLAKSGRTLILDCCRKKYNPMPDTVLAEFANKLQKRSMDDARKYYEEEILKCGKQRLVLYSCDEDECSNDDSRNGGYYSYNLLKIARNWYENRGYTSFPMTLTMVQAHEQTKNYLKGIIDNQTPQIEKPREEPYYPLAIIK